MMPLFDTDVLHDDEGYNLKNSSQYFIHWILLFISPQDKYILKLVRAMEEVFLDQFGVSAALVADVHHYVYRSTGGFRKKSAKPSPSQSRTKLIFLHLINLVRLQMCFYCKLMNKVQSYISNIIILTPVTSLGKKFILSAFAK